jgi:anti-anti-sigma regulatory factor/anti-sigma regulatory factor (Ser/Thr protein kinase)
MTNDPRSPAQPPGPGGGRWAARGSTAPDAAVPPVLDQVFDADSLYSLRAAVAAHASEAGLPPGRVSDAVAAVHELAANSVRHGAGHGRLRVWNREADLHCLVTDDGAAPAADAVPAGAGVGPAGGGLGPADGTPKVDGLAAGPWHTGAGHGLWLVHRLADQVSLQAGPGGSSAAVSFALGLPASGTPIQLATHSGSGCTVIIVTGEFGQRAADQVIDAVDGVINAVDGVIAAGAPRLILDLAALTRWDSSGVAALLAVRQRVDAHPPARLVLAGLPDRFAQRLRDSGLAARFTIAGTAQHAIRLLTP